MTMGVDAGRSENLGTMMKSTTGNLLGYNYYIFPTHKVYSNLPYYAPKDLSNQCIRL